MGTTLREADGKWLDVSSVAALSRFFSKHNLRRPVMETHTKNASSLWGTATLLRDDFKREQEGAILPFTVTRRIDIAPEPTKDEVSEAYRESKAELGAEIREVQRGIAQIMEEVTT